MSIIGLSRAALGVGLAVTMLVGCGSQGQVGITGVMPLSTPPGSHVGQRLSSQAPATSNDNLLYLADGKKNLLVFSYPQGAFVERITSVPKPWGLCSDSIGNVFVLNRHPYQVLEFVHGGTSPINTLNLQYFAQGCSVDPTTGNLAVPQSNSIAIFDGAQGSPQIYTDPNFSIFDMCTYDTKGNLFISGFRGTASALTELKVGSSSFRDITLSEHIQSFYGVQWDGTYLAIDNFTGRNASIYQVKVSGSSGEVVGKTPLRGPVYGWFSWIQGDTVIAPVGGDYRKVHFWRYPAGGAPKKSLDRHDFRHDAPVAGITVSVAPSGSHIRE